MLVHEKLRKGENFTQVDRLIADYLLAAGDSLRKETVREVGEKLYVAPSSVVRLCKKIGYRGFNEFKEAYLKEAVYLASHFQQLDANYPFRPGEEPEVLAGKMLALHQEILADCHALLSSESLRQAVELVAQSRVVYMFGSGTQMGVAADFAEKMSKIGRDVYPISQNDMIMWKAANAGPDHCFILISYTGETSTALHLARLLQKRKIPTIAITSYGSNTLSGLCRCSLYLSTREKLVKNLGPFGTTLSMVYLLDLIYSCIFSRDYQENLHRKITNAAIYDGRHSKNPVLEDPEDHAGNDVPDLGGK